jgi:hypothetical protein
MGRFCAKSPFLSRDIALLSEPQKRDNHVIKVKKQGLVMQGQLPGIYLGG